MTSTATRMQPVQPGRSERTVLKPTKKSVRHRSIDNTHSGSFEDEAVIVGRSLPGIGVTETATGFTIVVPLNGTDARQVYVFAMPRSVLIEIRIRNAVAHFGAIHKEIQHQHVTRELKFHEGIKEGSTRVRLIGNNLEITCFKALNFDEKHWSELVQLDTRASLGCV